MVGRWGLWHGRTMARPYIAAVCRVAAVRRTGGSGAGRVSAVRWGEGGGD